MTTLARHPNNRRSNVEILEKSGKLGDICERLGAKEGEQPQHILDKINDMTPLDICQAWSGWHIGDPSWAGMIIGIYEDLGGTERQYNKTHKGGLGW